MTETVSGSGRGTGRANGAKSATRRSKGLTIERIFTRPGVHPYDEVTWERRDVVMTNWRDGSVIFDQKGVEFPDFWSVNAANIVTTKYFRGAVGTPQREWSLKQLIDRVVKTYRRVGEENGYFATPDDAEIFEHELTWSLLHQVFSFNSPVWFNVGTSAPAQVSACFILAVDDTMDSILNWYREEGLIFKGGSGAGLNLSRIRSSKELLSSGGTASGPVSFMRGADASAGTIKSGGATRRAAKMVILDVDHPDVEQFIETKAREEEKIRVLRDAGFDMDLGGSDITSVQYQNANNSVRVSDEFMRAVEAGDKFALRARTTGEPVDEVDAKTLFRKMAEAAWACADPGIQYDDTINDWHTCPETGRITASNPCCFVGGTLVPTAVGPLALEQLVKRVDAGEDVLVHAYDIERAEFVERSVVRGWVAGRTRHLVDVSTDSGLRLRCTPEHRFLTAAGWIEASQLIAGNELVANGRAVRVAAVDPVELDDEVEVFDIEVQGLHNFVVAGEGVPGVVVHNSEYMHLDNSSCNLASLNLMKFLRDDDTFDAQTFAKVVELVITAMDISICFADFPTEAIRDTTRAYRQLGIGYANLGALLMATGHGYDSEGGRAMAAAITSLMTGTAYKRSAELAGIVGPYDGYARNADAHKRVMRKHAAASDAVRSVDEMDQSVQRAATKAWEQSLEIGEKNGWRNAQASVLAPTGCLTPDTLVTTDRGLVRLGELGDVYGDRWQDLDVQVSTDEGPRQATKFFVNGEEPTRRVVTEGGYRIQGTLTHQVKVVDPETSRWVWKRLADIQPGDLVPMQMGTLVGGPQRVALPVLEQAYYAGDRHVHVPDAVTTELAELVGYFMGDGSLHAKGIRLCVADADLDVVERLRVLGKELFGIEAEVSQQQGYHEVSLSSVRLARWWQAAGFAKALPAADHVGKGWVPRMPSALLETNDVEVYAAFVRGLFEADGSVTAGVPSLSTASEAFAAEIRTVLLVLGIATTTRETESGWGTTQTQIRVRSLDYALTYDETVGFLSERKARLLPELEPAQSGNRDHVHLARETWDELVPSGHRFRSAVVQSLKTGGVTRTVARRLFEETLDPRLAAALGYLFETVAANEDGGVQPTYDLSVPDNVTYVANGLVSHNTIGLMMDCDTTGIEPDLALVKFKKLVGGGSMQIVNQTVPRALRKLGYQEEQVEAIVEYIAEHGHVVDAPGLRPEHYEVFDCAMGTRAIRPMGHVNMMAAVQPFISGAISKCVVGETLITTEDGLVRIGSLHRGEAPDSFRDEFMEVASLRGPQKTDAFYYGGVRSVREVVLRSGHQVTGTPNHRLLVATPSGPDWRYLSEIGEGDYVAVKYGADMWSTLPVRFDDFRPSPSYGSQKTPRIPAEMTAELAFLLGAYAAEGHTTESTWTIVITNSVDTVLDRVRAAWQDLFGLDARIERREGKCPQVIVSSKTAVQFLQYVGCGSRASKKRIPDAVLRSPRSMVLAFLQGLALDAYVHVPSESAAQAKWAIRLDAPGLLDDLQAVLVNLGVVHGRVHKHNKSNGKTYDEVYACGEEARNLSLLVPFLEPDKAAKTGKLETMTFGPSTSDIVPSITPRQLYEAIPRGISGRNGQGDRKHFAYLLDPRTTHVSRRTLEKVAAIPGARLPQWVYDVIWDNLRFSPVTHVDDAGDREVYDVSVPVTHAFVGNGVVNHNTVNLPESATVEEIEHVYAEGWKLGLKALAVYRDNCKVGQPLSDARGKKAAEAAAEPPAQPVVEYRPTRKRLPKSRPSKTVSFTVGGAEGYMTASSYPDDGLGEIFLKMSKQGSTLAGMMDAFSIAISIGLQYGVPLETFVQKFVNMRFEPAGLTDDPDVRMSASIMDYIFRRLALDFLEFEERAALGVHTAEERARQLETGSYEPVDSDEEELDVEELAQSAPRSEPAMPKAAEAEEAPQVAATAGSSTELIESQQGRNADAPLCFTCGTKMRPAGSCYVCEGCGSTSGCS